MEQIYRHDIEHAISVIGVALNMVENDVRECKAVYDDPQALAMCEEIYTNLKKLQEYEEDLI